MLVRYSVIVWDNAGARTEEQAGNALYHWSRSVHLNRNLWTQRATADEWFD